MIEKETPGLTPSELETTKRLDTSLSARVGTPARGHMYCKQRWMVKVNGRRIHRCTKCSKGGQYFLIPDVAIGKMAMGTCWKMVGSAQYEAKSRELGKIQIELKRNRAELQHWEIVKDRCAEKLVSLKGPLEKTLGTRSYRKYVYSGKYRG